MSRSVRYLRPSERDPRSGSLTSACSRRRRAAESESHARNVGAFAAEALFRVIREDGSTKPGRYLISGPGHVVNKAGYAVNTSVKTGTRVRVYFTGTGDARTIDHIVVLD